MKFKKIWLWIWLVTDVLYTLFFSFMLSASIVENELHDDIRMFADMMLSGIFFSAVSVKGLINLSKNKKYVIPINFLAKVSGGFFLFSFIFLFPEIIEKDGIYPFSIFMLMSLLSGTPAALLVVRRNKKNNSKVINCRIIEFSYYNSEYLFEKASKEYALIGKMECDHEFSLEETEKIKEYAAMPIVYLFWWLLENRYMSDYFYSQHSEEEIEEVLSRKKTPLEFFLNDCNHCLSRKDISAVVICFIDRYFETFYQNEQFYSLNSAEYYTFDYYEAIRNENHNYFCTEFEWEVCEILNQKINERYREYKNLSLNHISEGEITERYTEFFWKLKNTRLRVACSAAVKEEYIRKCETELNSLDEFQTEMLSRMLSNSFKTVSTNLFEKFKPIAITIYKSHGEETAYVIIGEVELGMKNGIAVYVRNGIILGIDYASYRFVPWDLRDEYEMYKDKTDFSKCSDKAIFDKLVSNGMLVLYEYDEKNKFYVTKCAVKQLEKLKMRIEAIRAVCLCGDVKILPKFRENNPVPENIRISADGGYPKNVYFAENIRVWL